MSHLFQKLKKNNDGSSLLMVVIGVVFVAMIGVIVLSIATNYLLTAIVNQKSSDNFYDAEGVLAEVRTGLEEVASTRSEKEYKNVLENYSASSGVSRTKMFSQNYITNLAQDLAKQGETVVCPSSDGSNFYMADLNKIKHFVGKDNMNMVEPVSGQPLRLKVEKSGDDYSLTLQNLFINYFRKNSDYRSSIQTDIVMKVPDYHLDGGTTFNELKKYIVITDDNLDIQSSMKANFSGNVYTGNEDDGILLEANSTTKFNSDKIITRGNVNLKSGGSLSVFGKNDLSLGDLWAENLKLTPINSTSPASSNSTFNLGMNSYIANDLTIDDDNSTVNLAGNYYGYSYNKDNTSTTSTQNADYSSAILVNGRNTSLQTEINSSSKLESLILAGRSFVSRNDSSNNKTTSDIMMGESLALKSNQIAYLVPKEYISVNHNPVFSFEKNSAVVNEAQLLADYGTYLNSSQPVTKNYTQSGFVYFYLNFKDEQSVNKYFSTYYGIDQNKSQVREKAKTYISTADGSGIKISPALWLIAGNIISNYEESIDDLGVKQPNYYTGDPTTTQPDSELLNDGKTKGMEYTSRQLTLLPGKSSDMRLSSSASKLVADKIIDFSKVTANAQKTCSNGGKLIVSKGGYSITVSSPKKGIIIADGDVNIQSDFEGLILSNGKVYVSVSNVDAKANIIMVNDMLKEIVNDPNFSKYFREAKFFDGKTDPEVSMSDYFSYSNWKKNAI